MSDEIKLDSEAIRIMQEKFPKFSKIQKSMISNPEYGITLSREAVRYLKKRGVIPRRKYVRRIRATGAEDGL